MQLEELEEEGHRVLEEMEENRVKMRSHSGQHSQQQNSGFFARRRQSVTGYFSDWTKWLRSNGSSVDSGNGSPSVYSRSLSGGG